MADVTINFEYDLPDEYLHQTSELGLKGQWTYIGPEKFWVFVDNSTGKFDYAMHYVLWNKKDVAGSTEYAEIKAGMARKAVLVDANAEPLMASFFQQFDRNGLPQKEYKIGKVVYYSRPDPITPDHAYEIEEITYDLEKNEWVKPFPWKKPHITVEQHEMARIRLISGVDDDIADEDTTDEMKTKLQAFKAELEAIPTKFAGWSPWQIPFPSDPRFELPPTE